MHFSDKKRVLSVFSLVMINVIAIDSLRNLPTTAVTGLHVVGLYLIAAIGFLIPCLLVTAELATHYPKTGGAYIWVREAFGKKWGFLAIWLQWIYNVFWYPTILSFLTTNLAYIIDPALATNKLFVLSMIISMFLLATFLNCWGMKLSSLVSTICAIGGTLLPLTLLIILGIFWMLSGHKLAVSFAAPNWIPQMHQFPNIAFLVIVMFSLMGLEMSAVHAESVKKPKHDYPRALIYSSILIVVTLVLATLAIIIVVPRNEIDLIGGLDQALDIFLTNFSLRWALPIIIGAILLGGFGSMAAWIIGPTKGIVVAAEDKTAPSILAYRNNKDVPVIVLIIQAIIVVILCGIFLFFPTINTSYWILSALTAQLALLFYICLFAAAIRLRSKTPYMAHAFRIPGGKVGIWLVGLLGIFSCLLAFAVGFIPPKEIEIHNIYLYEIILIAGIIIFALPPFIIHRIYRKKHSNPKTADHLKIQQLN